MSAQPLFTSCSSLTRGLAQPHSSDARHWSSLRAFNETEREGKTCSFGPRIEIAARWPCPRWLFGQGWQFNGTGGAYSSRSALLLSSKEAQSDAFAVPSITVAVAISRRSALDCSWMRRDGRDLTLWSLGEQLPTAGPMPRLRLKACFRLGRSLLRQLFSRRSLINCVSYCTVKTTWAKPSRIPHLIRRLTVRSAYGCT
jgi:hypothetical protein